MFPSSVAQKVGLLKLLALSGIGVAVLTPVGFLAWQELVPRPVVSVPKVLAPEARPIEQSAVTEAPEPVEAAPAPAADVPQPKADARPAGSGALTAELGVLDVARSKLAAGDARGALGVLDDYTRTYPRGRLNLEAEVLRIDALAKAGETGAAKKRAEAFLKRYPKSVLASRVRGYLDEPR
jgi:TolA-binding protein